MYSITINIKNKKLVEKVSSMLEHFKDEGVEIVLKEDMDDLKLLRATREEESIPFDEYINDCFGKAPGYLTFLEEYHDEEENEEVRSCFFDA